MSAHIRSESMRSAYARSSTIRSVLICRLDFISYYYVSVARLQLEGKGDWGGEGRLTSCNEI